MHCIRCGREVQADASFCWNCGAAIGSPVPETTAATPVLLPESPILPAAPMPLETAAAASAIAAPVAEPTPGGFWRRVFAVCIDWIVLSILNLPFGMLWLPAEYQTLTDTDLSPEQVSAMLSAYLLVGGTGFVISWAYHAGLESSATQGTLGKLALGLQVTDAQHRRLSFARATGRFFSKIVTNLTFGIGYLMAAFTWRKRALHDMIAGTRVIRG